MKRSVAFRASAIAAVCLLCSHAWGINKCTAVDGKVVFQDAPCSGKGEELKLTNRSTSSQAGEWKFEKRSDAMTGSVTCIAYSPSSMVLVRGTPSVYMVVALRNDLRAVTVKSDSDTREIFHNDLSGMGIKVDDNAFVTLDRKAGQTSVGFASDKELQVIQQLMTGKQIRIRARFWPWDNLGDSQPIGTVGFKQAYALAQDCAKTNG